MDKDFLLNDSETFCILPWLHLMMIPEGKVYPCCVSASQEDFGSIDDDIDVTINNEAFKTLRKNMLTEVKSNTCELCYSSETFGGNSLRKTSNELFKKHINDAATNTNEDGSINDFKLRYVDTRFSNICNFKCRTCNGGYSSSFAAELAKHFPSAADSTILIKPKESANALDKILDQLDHMEMIYFAGGEPLVTDEHYIILDELLKRNKTDIPLRYNTNASNLNYKNKDIIKLWKNFKSVEVYASIDHYGDRAEYIRHGTDWGIVENNLKTMQDIENIHMGYSVVVSTLNYLTIPNFLYYMDEVGLNGSYSYNISYSPIEFDPTILPIELKEIGNKNIEQLMNRYHNSNERNIAALSSIMDYVSSKDNWDIDKSKFQKIIKDYDRIRNEDFCKTFPELASMMDL
jgi:organic radical activating enzyme